MVGIASSKTPGLPPVGAIHFITEIPKFSRAKFEIATGEVLNPIKRDDTSQYGEAVRGPATDLARRTA